MFLKLESETVTFLSLLASVVSAVAAIIAAFYSRKAATARDEQPSVEQNTQRLEPARDQILIVSAPSNPQPEPEIPPAQPERISIDVAGEGMGEAPIELLITLQDSSVRVSRAERLSDAGRTLGSSPCKATDNPLVFKSILAPEKVSQWWGAGESTGEGEARGVLRVYLLGENKREVSRDIPVSIVEGLRNVGIATLVVWTIKGSV